MAVVRPLLRDLQEQARSHPRKQQYTMCVVFTAHQIVFPRQRTHTQRLV